MNCKVPPHRRYSNKYPPKFGSQILLYVMVNAFLFAGPAPAFAQRPQPNGGAASGILKVEIPSGILGDDFWIYVNGRLRSSPPHGTQPAKLNLVFSDSSGFWEGFGSDGLAVSSARLKQYLASGDRYGIFRAFEFQVPPGLYTVEILVPSRERGYFLSSSITDVQVRSRGTTEAYVDVPVGFSSVPIARAADQVLGYGLCLPTLSEFDINASSDTLLEWGLAYRNDPLRRSLMKAAAAYRPSESVLMLDIDSRSRQYDGRQIQIMLQRFSAPPFRQGDIAVCRKLLPQFANAFDEFDATIKGVYRDRETLEKFVADVAAAKRVR